MMVQAMLDLDLKGGAVCDLGCGTGVLAILAGLGAVDVRAVDIDERAVENTRITWWPTVLSGCMWKRAPWRT